MSRALGVLQEGSIIKPLELESDLSEDPPTLQKKNALKLLITLLGQRGAGAKTRPGSEALV